MMRSAAYQRIGPANSQYPPKSVPFDLGRETILIVKVSLNPGSLRTLTFVTASSAPEDQMAGQRRDSTARVRVASPEPGATEASKGALCSLFPELLDLTPEEVDRAIRESRQKA